MENKKYFYLIFLIIIFIFLELLSFIYFKYISKDELNLERYEEKRIGALNYNFFEEVGLVLPNPNTYQIHYTKEFNDKFFFKKIVNLNAGFPDDGIDDRQIKAVAIGDSFTRGVGSTNNIISGWVELIENKNKDIDIVNLGHLGNGINDQSYAFERLKKYFEYDLIIYNFFSGGDYNDNLSDINYSYYLNKNFENFGKDKVKKIIDDLNIRHGYKYHLEYLLDTNFRIHTLYFSLKIIDYLIALNLFPKYKFSFKINKLDTRTNKVPDDIFKLSDFPKGKFHCKTKYCYQEMSEEFKKDVIIEKIVSNSATKINEFYKNNIDEEKKLIFILHPSARNFYVDQTIFNYNKIDLSLLKKLDRNIKIINLGPMLKSIDDQIGDKKIFHKFDGHYNKNGYEIVSKLINMEIKKILKK